MMNKEKLEFMKEKGRGGLSKGLSILRSAAANVSAANTSTPASADQEDDEAKVSMAAAAEASSQPKMSYDDLVALSMKLTRQNKMMKAQFQKMQTQLPSLLQKEADCTVLTTFVRDIVGIEVDACLVPAAATPTEKEKSITPSIDATQLQARYQIREKLREKEQMQAENQFKNEITRLQRLLEAASMGSNHQMHDSVVTTTSLLPFSPLGAAAAPSSAPPAATGYADIDLLTPASPVAPSAPVAPHVSDPFAPVPPKSELTEALERSLEDANAQLRAVENQLTSAQHEKQEATTQYQELWDSSERRIKELMTENLALAAQVNELTTTNETNQAAQQTWWERLDAQIQLTQEAQQKLSMKEEVEKQLTTQVQELEKRLQALKEEYERQMERVRTLEETQEQTSSEAPSLEEIDRLKALVEQLQQQNEQLKPASSDMDMQAEVDRLEAAILHLHDENAALKSKMCEQTLELERTNTMYGEAQRELETMQQKMAKEANASKELERVQVQVAQLQRENAQLKDKVASSPPQQESPDQAMDQNEDLQKHMVASEAQSQRQIQELEATIAELRQTQEQLIADKAASHPNAAMQAEVERLEAAILHLHDENAALKTNLNDMTAAATASQLQDLERVKMLNADAEQQNAALHSKVATLEQELQQKAVAVEATNAHVEDLKQELQVVRAQSTKLTEQIGKLKYEITTIQASKAALQEELETLRLDKNASIESVLGEAEAKQQQLAQEKSQMQEEVDYLKSKVEMLIKEIDASCKRSETLEATVTEKETQIQKMAAAQTALTSESLELKKQIVTVTEDLQLATSNLEAHATKAEKAELLRAEMEGKMNNTKLQMDALREDHVKDFEMLREAKEAELDRLRQERCALATKLRETDDAKAQCDQRIRELEVAVDDAKQSTSRLESHVAQLTNEIATVRSELFETKKALSDKMALATRLQTENMGIAGKQAEQAALIENALRDAKERQKAQEAAEQQVAIARQEVTKMRQLTDDTMAEMEQLKQQWKEREEQMAIDRDALTTKFQEALDAEKELMMKERERVEQESKQKSKLALQVVMEKEKEIEQLTKRLEELEEDVRSGEADNRKIFEVAHLQAKREAETRAMVQEIHELRAQVDALRQGKHQLMMEKSRHEQELTALMQTQRRDGVNMEYLKNVVVQYMSFRPGSSQQTRLIPVLSTLLQFTPEDMKEIKNASSSRRSSWTAWGVSGSSSNDKKPEYKPIVLRQTASAQSLPTSFDTKRAASGRPPTHHHHAPPPAPVETLTENGGSSRTSTFALPHGLESVTDPHAFSPAARESTDF